MAESASGESHVPTKNHVEKFEDSFKSVCKYLDQVSLYLRTFFLSKMICTISVLVI